jgi:hypothetical protein
MVIQAVLARSRDGLIANLIRNRAAHEDTLAARP